MSGVLVCVVYVYNNEVTTNDDIALKTNITASIYRDDLSY